MLQSRRDVALKLIDASSATLHELAHREITKTRADICKLGDQRTETSTSQRQEPQRAEVDGSFRRLTRLPCDTSAYHGQDCIALKQSKRHRHHFIHQRHRCRHIETNTQTLLRPARGDTTNPDTTWRPTITDMGTHRQRTTIEGRRSSQTFTQHESRTSSTHLSSAFRPIPNVRHRY